LSDALRTKTGEDGLKARQDFFEQARRDALFGTFGEYSQALFASIPGEYANFKTAQDLLTTIRDETEDEDLDQGRLRFTLCLDAGQFSNAKVGLQHLLGVLVGDMFNRARSALDPKARIIAKEVDLGGVRNAYAQKYRSDGHDISQIRSLFQLDQVPNGRGRANLRMPLLAFSFKPRLGFSQKFIKDVALGVLRSGFNVVELDTRNLQTADSSWRDFFVDIASEATQIETHVARFSPNLTMPLDEAIEIAEKFHKVHSEAPWVVKVDGGLDGLSTIQALRTHFSGRQPIITCYPLLNKALEDRIGKDTLFQFLCLSGADIIYPGGTPRLGSNNRGIDLQQLVPGYTRYWKIIDNAAPMPSIAGGIHAGHLAAYHEMFGPNIAYFLGGAVALHKRGAYSGYTSPRKRAGAELCVEIIRACAKIETDQRPNYADLLESFGSVQNEYIDDPADEQWQYQDPELYIKDAIGRYTTRS
jgi:Ribulose bisphosphate carboxylase large chain, catalytic domain